MTVKDIIERLDLKCLNEANLDAEVSGAYASDLLSDVMGNARSGQVWITMQTHKNVTAIASLKDIPAVIIVRDGVPDDDMLEHAKDEDICLLVSKDATFEVCGKLYELLR
ncbi:MAG: serine kinase [Bacteroidales bacterium]|jgi:serine kinase of HPr protein (carbohydrate metabolism regulator)|nr:serine kinase [Bacteroidales bacterium]